MDEMLEATAAAEERHFWFLGLRRNARSLLAAALGGRPVALIVDCGAGTGRNLDWLSTFGPSVGVELSATGPAHGRARGRVFVRGSVLALPLASAAADVATSFDVLYALDQTETRQALGEMLRVLKPGGLAVINTAALPILRGSHSPLTGEKTRHTRASLGRALREAGFHVERLTYTNMLTLPVTLAMRLGERVTGHDRIPSARYLRMPPAPANALFDLAMRIEHVWLGMAALPIGSSVFAIARKPPGHRI
jgi:SAM-dependent methyltransferase